MSQVNQSAAKTLNYEQHNQAIKLLLLVSFLGLK